MPGWRVCAAIVIGLASACSLETEPVPGGLGSVGTGGSGGSYSSSSTGTASECDSDAQCASTEYCDIGASICTPKLAGGLTCTGDNQCADDSCLDGACCRTTCNGPCRHCNLAGAEGTCSDVPAGLDPDDECSGALACNGSGACAKPRSAACAMDQECAGGACEDGYCCNETCEGECKRCDLPGNIGTCGNVPMGQQAAPCNTAGQACDGAGSCKLANGTVCTAAADCFSGFCPPAAGFPDVCCNVACDGTCQSCNAQNTGGVNGTCGFVATKTDPESECPGVCNATTGSGCCNGSGVCNP